MSDSFFSSDLEGFGGWLILFQFRIYSSIFRLLVFSTDTILAVIFIAMMVICLVLFYMRKASFRIVYIILVAVILVIDIMALPYSLYYLIADCVVEGLIITALFVSRRVRNTFY